MRLDTLHNMNKVNAKLIKRTTKGDSWAVPIISTLKNDSSFPFKEDDLLEISIENDSLVIKKI